MNFGTSTTITYKMKNEDELKNIIQSVKNQEGENIRKVVSSFPPQPVLIQGGGNNPLILNPKPEEKESQVSKHASGK
jgi:hypothetical protein